MSNTSSNSLSMPRASAVFNAWSREPLVRMSLRPAEAPPRQRGWAEAMNGRCHGQRPETHPARWRNLSSDRARSCRSAHNNIFVAAWIEAPSSPNISAMNRVMRWSIFGHRISADRVGFDVIHQRPGWVSRCCCHCTGAEISRRIAADGRNNRTDVLRKPQRTDPQRCLALPVQPAQSSSRYMRRCRSY